MRLLFLLLLIGLKSQCQTLNRSDALAANSQGMCDGVVVNPDELISARTPALEDVKFGDSSPLPAHCLASLNEALAAEINNFRQQDEQNLQSLVNNYCSHRKGWMEYQPGTCQAGGPPPICPVRHWYQNYGRSMGDFADERRKVYNRRLASLLAKKRDLMSGACDCWLADIKRNGVAPTYSQQTEYLSQPSQSYPTTGIKMPCLGEAPAGFRCENGFLVEIGAKKNLRNNTGLSYENQKKIQEKAQEKVVEEARSLAINKILTYAGKRFSSLAVLKGFYKAVSENPYTAVALSVFDATDIGTFSSIYQKELSRAGANVNELERLYEEQRRYKANLNMTTANVQQRKNEIARYRSELGKNIFNLNNAADGIERANELGCCNCYNVLNYNNSLVTNGLQELMNKEIEW